MIPQKPNPLFRPVALDKLSSPDALDELMHITSPQSWLLIVAVGALIVVAVLWGIFGTILIGAPGRGTLVGTTNAEGKQVLTAVVYVSARDAAQIRPGMEARLSLETFRLEETGYLLGQVSSVSEEPASPEILATMGGLSTGTVLYAVQIDLLPDAGTRSGYQWSNGRGAEGTLRVRTPLSAEIVISRRRPITAVFPSLG
jgi:hypothetical protein